MKKPRYNARRREKRRHRLKRRNEYFLALKKTPKKVVKDVLSCAVGVLIALVFLCCAILAVYKIGLTIFVIINFIVTHS